MGVAHRAYDDRLPRSEYLAWTRRWIRAARAVLDPLGSLFLNVGGKPIDPWTALDVAGGAPYLFPWEDRNEDRPHPATFPVRCPTAVP